MYAGDSARRQGWDGAAHLTAEPPVIVRTHATDARIVIPAALKVYHNLYTEEKFNGESLTTSEPRGVRQVLSLAMSKLGSTHITNIHILANLEPFRYGDERFIKQCVIAARDRLGARAASLSAFVLELAEFAGHRESAAPADRSGLDLVRELGAVFVESGY